MELIERKSVIIFDEIQLFPKARQAIKHLVKDGRYDYIETGSLISIKKNVKDILIPSEEHKIYVYPMDYEEFLWETGGNPNVLDLYYDDLKKIDTSGRITDMYKSVPSQLAGKKKHYVITAATGKQKTRKDEERLFELIDSGLVLPCYNVTNPGVSLSQTKDIDCFKLYLSDIGLFTTMLFNDSENGIEDIYCRRRMWERLER